MAGRGCALSPVWVAGARLLIDRSFVPRHERKKQRALDDEEMKRRDALLKDKQTAAWFADRAKRANEAWQAEVDDFMGPAKE